MLYMIGAVQIDTFPFSANNVTRRSSADWATKPLLNGLKNAEFMGEGDDYLTLRGHLLPAKIGGLTELEMIRGHMTSGAALPVMRGDGTPLGTFAIMSLQERHSDLLRDGIGAQIRYTIRLKKVPPDRSTMQQVIPSLLQIFNLLG
ncbi:phage protein U [Labrenzia sp. EL_126]|nr:phage protein U [Labrenzia sp. EL_126]